MVRWDHETNRRSKPNVIHFDDRRRKIEHSDALAEKLTGIKPDLRIGLNLT